RRWPGGCVPARCIRPVWCSGRCGDGWVVPRGFLSAGRALPRQVPNKVLRSLFLPSMLRESVRKRCSLSRPLTPNRAFFPGILDKLFPRRPLRASTGALSFTWRGGRRDADGRGARLGPALGGRAHLGQPLLGVATILF